MPESRKRKITKKVLKNRRYRANKLRREQELRLEVLRKRAALLQAEVNKEKILSRIDDMHGE